MDIVKSTNHKSMDIAESKIPKSINISESITNNLISWILWKDASKSYGNFMDLFLPPKPCPRELWLNVCLNPQSLNKLARPYTVKLHYCILVLNLLSKMKSFKIFKDLSYTVHVDVQILKWTVLETTNSFFSYSFGIHCQCSRYLCLTYTTSPEPSDSGQYMKFGAHKFNDATVHNKYTVCTIKIYKNSTASLA